MGLFKGTQGRMAWNCYSCGRINHMAFCPECGSKRPPQMVCKACGHEFPPGMLGYMYCPNCGHQFIKLHNNTNEPGCRNCVYYNQPNYTCTLTNNVLNSSHRCLFWKKN